MQVSVVHRTRFFLSINKQATKYYTNIQINKVFLRALCIKKEIGEKIFFGSNEKKNRYSPQK